MDINTLGSLQDNIIDNIKGLFMISPGQFPLLDNSIIKITDDKFIIIVDDNRNIFFNYDIKNIIPQRDLNNNLLPLVEIKVFQLKKYNMEENKQIEEMIHKVLKLEPPFSIYVSYNKEYNNYTITHGYPYHFRLLSMVKIG